jgi:hypothetical protein
MKRPDGRRNVRAAALQPASAEHRAARVADIVQTTPDSAMKPSLRTICLAHPLRFLFVLLLACDAYAQGVLVPHVEAPPRNALALAGTAAGQGARQCLPALTALSAPAIQSTTSNDVLFDWDRRRQGASPVFSLIGLEYAGANAALSVTAVPEVDGSCTVSAERISVAPLACKVVAQQELTGYRATPLLDHMTVYADARDPGSTVSLIDEATGCLVIRRYVKFSSKAVAAANQSHMNYHDQVDGVLSNAEFRIRRK